MVLPSGCHRVTTVGPARPFPDTHSDLGDPRVPHPRQTGAAAITQAFQSQNPAHADSGNVRTAEQVRARGSGDSRELSPVESAVPGEGARCVRPRFLRERGPSQTASVTLSGATRLWGGTRRFSCL